MNEHDRLVALERDVAHIDKTLTGVQGELRDLNQKVDAGITEIRMAIGAMKDESKKDLKWTMAMFSGGVLFLAGLMYFLSGRIPVPAAEAKAESAVFVPAPSNASQGIPCPGDVEICQPVTSSDG